MNKTPILTRLADCALKVPLLLFSCQVLSGALAQAQDIQVQRVRMDTGWNLIAFQVVPSDPAPATVFGTLGNAFNRAWGYDNASRRWVSYARPGTEQGGHNDIAPLGAIEIGRAYWVHMSQAVTNWQVAGSVPAVTAPLVFTNGWNLVGIPTGTGALPEAVNMPSVLAASGLDYDTILRWEQSLYLKFTPTDNDVDDFTTFDPSRGYWVNIKSSSFSLQPRLLCSVRADVDVEPQGNYPSFEDLQISPSALPLGPSDQTHIVFRPGEDVQQISVANTGGGILLWSLEWAPQDATDANWLSLSSQKGVATIENDVMSLYLDRANLFKGTYHGTLTLRTTAGNRSFTVVAHVPGLSGEWRGAARIESVNDRRNAVPDIDLHLSFFEDPSVPGLLRGHIDSRNALLWPVDVPLIGHVLAGAGNSFSLGGAYILPPGDQNNPPYQAFNPNEGDVDWNNDNKLDATNPYPFPLYRAVTFVGTLVEASALSGYAIEGDYSELVYGLLRQPIRLRGSFAIRRESPRPFANRRPVANAESPLGTDPVVLRSAAFSPAQTLVGTRTNLLSVESDLVLEDISVDLAMAGPTPSNLLVTLRAPSGHSVILHNRANVSPGAFSRISFPSLRLPAQRFSNFMQPGVRTKGNWALTIQNFGGGGTLSSWSLRLQGQPVFDVAGQVIGSSGEGGLPADVLLNGLPITTALQAGPDGSFVFSRVPNIPLNLSASFNGFEPLDTPGLSSLYTVPDYGVTTNPLQQVLAAKFRPLPAMPIPALATSGFTNFGTTDNPIQLVLRPRPELGTDFHLLAFPSSGFGPLTVTLRLMSPPAGIAPGSTIDWDFGNGATISGTDLYTVQQTYANVSFTGYQARVTYPGGSSEVTIQVLPSPGNTPYANNLFQIHFSGGGTLPANLDFLGTPLEPYLMTQHADAANFDIDRAPRTAPANRVFDADGLAHLNAADGLGIFKGEDTSYQNPLDACADSTDPGRFNPYPKLGASGDCLHPRYRMLCNIGPPIIPMPVTEVFNVNLAMPPIQTPQPDPLAAESAQGIARVREFRLITGPLASFWKEGSIQ